MSLDLEQIKLNQIEDKLQVTVFNLEGKVLASCNSVLNIDTEKSIFDQFLFLKSLEEVFTSLPENEEQIFTEVEWEEGKQGLFHLTFKKLKNEEAGAIIIWTIIDNTFYYDKLLNLQQSRNDSVISEEFAQIKKRIIEAENELLSFKNEELERVQSFKTMFFAKVSHEMRTPLQSISGLIDLLSNQSDDPNLKSLKSTSRHLNAIINDILDLSKIEAGKLEFESIHFDLTETMESVLHGFGFACKQKGIELKTNISKLDFGLVADPTRLSQIIYNLLGNSVKFTDKGKVELTIVAKELDDKKVALEFSVSDTGPGMDKTTVDKILEPYQQASSKTAGLYGGTGLGLSIAKQLIEAFGGALKIGSTPNVGTTMEFTIHLQKGNRQENAPDSPISLSHLKILLAEDDKVSAAVLKRQLEQSGANVICVENGNELINQAISSAFDIIISDFNLPGKTGLEALVQLRNKGDDVPFLLVTGEVFEEINSIVNWGHLLKPVEQEILIKTIYDLVADGGIKVDLTKINSMIEDKAFVQELLKTIQETLPIELLVLEKSHEDAVLLKKTLHKIKPSIDYLGIPLLSEMRSTLNTEISNQAAPKELAPLLSTFIKKVSLALKDLERRLSS